MCCFFKHVYKFMSLCEHCLIKSSYDEIVVKVMKSALKYVRWATNAYGYIL